MKVALNFGLEIVENKAETMQRRIHNTGVAILQESHHIPKKQSRGREECGMERERAQVKYTYVRI